MSGISRVIDVKTPLTAEQKDELLKQISEAHKVIANKVFELSELKEKMSSVKDEIEAQYEVVAGIVQKYDTGYKTEKVDCSVTYKDGVATFVDKNGEIREQRPITPDEQLALSKDETVQDADEFIRRISQQEDEKDNEEEEE